MVRRPCAKFSLLHRFLHRISTAHSTACQPLRPTQAQAFSYLYDIICFGLQIAHSVGVSRSIGGGEALEAIEHPYGVP